MFLRVFILIVIVFLQVLFHMVVQRRRLGMV